MLTKTAPMRVKALAAATAAEGTFEAIVSVFDNVDSCGDVVLKGAFTDTLKAWEDSGHPIPVLWSHNSVDPDFHIGQVLEAKETEEGLHIKAQLDLEGPGRAPQVYRLLRGGRVTQFSFAYDVLEGSWAKRDGQDVYELRKLKLFEVGPCLIGANQETRLIGAKSDDAAATAAFLHSTTRLTTEVKAGRVLSASNEGRIRTAVGELGAVLSALDTEDSKSHSTTTAREPGKAEDPPAGKAEDPMHGSPVNLLALRGIELAALAAAT